MEITLFLLGLLDFETCCFVNPTMNTFMIPTTRRTLLNRLRSDCSEMDWEDFFAAYQPILKNWARKYDLQANDADDLLGEIYLHLVPRLRRFTYSPEKRFRGWLKQTVASGIANYFEKRKREIGKPLRQDVMELAYWDEPAEELANELGSSLNQQEAQVDAIIANVKSRVKPLNWQAFLLTHVEGLDCKEAAHRLEIPLGKVHVARCRIRAMLTREGRKSPQGKPAQSGPESLEFE